ncbi:MAG: outer membrane lipoprotein-sorting protein [Acidobacteria bacterium CG_4_9_14_3_um_filter_49_7]|nr:MAG: outer membrane lipoprotein-sorting protein [Acidobacteria bacterium CG_4_9_14_3_um_filter_49_7]
MKKLCLICVLFVAGWLVSPVLASDHRAEDIAKKVDELYRSNSSYSELEMAIQTPHWKRTLVMKGWSKGTDQTFIRILKPKKEEGVGTLRIKTEMWNYLPKIGKVIKIPPSMMMSAWMGSDFTNDDLVREFTLLKDYTFKMITPSDTQPGRLYLEAKPKRDVPVVWARLLIEVRESNFLPVSEKYFDEKGGQIRELVFTEITDFGGRKVPAVMTLIPAGKPGKKTVIRYLKLKFDPPIQSDTFTLRHLRRPQEGLADDQTGDAQSVSTKKKEHPDLADHDGRVRSCGLFHCMVRWDLQRRHPGFHRESTGFHTNPSEGIPGPSIPV